MQISQAKAILFQQQSEWSKVMAEEAERQSYLTYGIILTVLAHLAVFIGNAFFASMLTFGLFRYGIGYYALYEGLAVLMAIASLWIIPPILAAVAPSFGGQKNAHNALKLFVFAMTPAWVGSMLGIVPIIGMLGMIAGGLFAIFLFWQHVTEAMSIPEDKKVVYVLASAACIIVVSVVINMIAGSIAATMTFGSLLSGRPL